MPDLEKVIKGLECCIKRDPDDYLRCDECPYPDGSACANRLKIDALELLKEQEPKEAGVCNGELFCKECGNKIKSYYRFCDYCGKAVKWE